VSRSFSSLIPLHGKHYISVKGPDTRKFLQGLISNDIYSLTNEKPIMASLLLAPKVRERALVRIRITFSREESWQICFFMICLHQIRRSHLLLSMSHLIILLMQKVLIEVNSQLSGAVIRYLTLYKLRAAIQYETIHNYQARLCASLLLCSSFSRNIDRQF
jgi:folate-binding Fe-S cluster repair protein YgfZ